MYSKTFYTFEMMYITFIPEASSPSPFCDAMKYDNEEAKIPDCLPKNVLK